MSEIRVEQAWENADIQLNKGDANNRSSSANVAFLVFGAQDEITAINAAYSEAPADISGIPKTSAEVSERLTEDTWKIEISYGYTSSSSTGSSSEESTVSFDCGTGTRHVTNAIRQWELWSKPSTQKRDPKTFIGWNGKTGPDMQVTGVDVPFAQPRETYTKKMRLSQLSTSFKRRVASIVGCVNNAKWKGWEKGEVMFLGCSFSGTSSEEITVTFNFAIQMNETMVIADGVPPIKKEGYIYVWTMPETVKPKSESNSPEMDVRAVYAAQVVQYADFASLGL